MTGETVEFLWKLLHFGRIGGRNREKLTKQGKIPGIFLGNSKHVSIGKNTTTIVNFHQNLPIEKPGSKGNESGFFENIRREEKENKRERRKEMLTTFPAKERWSKKGVPEREGHKASPGLRRRRWTERPPRQKLWLFWHQSEVTTFPWTENERIQALE